MMNEKAAWQNALSTLITDPDELLNLLELDRKMLAPAQAAALLFPLKVPRAYLRRIKKGNPTDPLLMQLLPHSHEQLHAPGYVIDPLHEAKFNPIPGLLHKYQSRVLITITSACAIHCRYCFRRHFPYIDNNPGTLGWNEMIAYINNHKNVNEVILSGGDPLAVSDYRLAEFTSKLATVQHVKRLRIHSRMPIVMPERITNQFMEWVQSMNLALVLVVHANHPNEINDEVIIALQLLKNIGVTLLNQSVLLKGVNDDTDVLTNLSEALFSAGILPYYLHFLDSVQGAAHFEVSYEKAKRIHAELAASLPGYLVPKLVREEPGQKSKTQL
jgi:EF-P beta-lysylation protein EpmB